MFLRASKIYFLCHVGVLVVDGREDSTILAGLGNRETYCYLGIGEL